MPRKPRNFQIGHLSKGGCQVTHEKKNNSLSSSFHYPIVTIPWAIFIGKLSCLSLFFCFRNFFPIFVEVVEIVPVLPIPLEQRCMPFIILLPNGTFITENTNVNTMQFIKGVGVFRATRSAPALQKLIFCYRQTLNPNLTEKITQ